MAAVCTLCDVCGIYASSEEQLRQHVEGRRHIVALQKLETARRSVYVRGFPPTETKYAEIKSLFEQFGSVVQVALDDKKFFAIVEFTNVDGALQALRCPNKLVLHGKRLVVKPREAKLQPTRVPHESPGLSSSSTPEPMETVANQQSMAPISSRVELPPDLLSQLQQAPTMTAQMELVAASYRMTADAMKAQCEVCVHLQRVFPRSLVILFGSVVSGHAFATSDCDVCILTDPMPRDRDDFAPQNYYNQQLLQLCLVSGPDPDCQSPASGVHLPQALFTTHFQQGAKSSSPQFDTILSVIQSDTRFTRVVPIPFARCPIVRFFYEPQRLHTDVSINNRLGPYNTRLIRAYCEFDTRFYAILSTLRLWIRTTGIKRAQLHNYALTLMVIRALQCSDPPVLPCLQDPGVWPINMAWYAQGFALTTNKPIVVDGWSCSYTPPGSLMPSKNTQTPASLLAHFFHFYSEVLDLHTHCVTVHVNPTRRVTIEEAIHLAQRDNASVKVSHFRPGQLCIQDPFELSHNVAKALSRDALILLVGHCMLALQQLQACGDSPSLLNLFSLGQLGGGRNEGEALLEKSVHLGLEDMASVFSGVQDQWPILSHLSPVCGQLDHTGAEVRRRLSLVLLRAVALTLEHTLGFCCVALFGSPGVSPEHCSAAGSPRVSPEHCGAAGSPGVSPEHYGEAGSPGVSPEHCGVAGNPLVSQEHCGAVGSGTHASSNEEGSSHTSVGSEDDMELDVPSRDGVRKRQRDGPREEVIREANESDDVSKRPRVVGSDAMATLSKAFEGLASTYTCVAYGNTWVHRRQARRHRGVDPVVSGATPVLSFTLTADSAGNEVGGAAEYGIRFTLMDSEHLSELHTFYAFFKKYLCTQR